MRPPAPPCCPNPGCVHHANPPGNFFWRRGTFTPKRTGLPLVRYQCKACRRTFSNRTFAPDRWQKRPDINVPLFSLLCSGVTQRRAAVLLGVARGTVCARLPMLANLARDRHAEAMTNGVLATTYAQFDEMETFVGAAPKALTIALTVRVKTGQILAIKVGRIPANGHLAKKGQQLYAWTVDQATATRASALQLAAKAIQPGGTVACDGHPAYPAAIAANIPLAVCQPVAAVKGPGFDPLFRINHV